MKTSHHARTRMAQRALREPLLALLDHHGQVAEQKGRVHRVYLPDVERARLYRELEEEVRRKRDELRHLTRQLKSCKRGMAVYAHDGDHPELITVMHITSRIRSY